MEEECNIIRNSEGYLVDTCTGEVLDFDNYSVVDYSNMEYYERTSTKNKQKRKTLGGLKVFPTSDMKKVVLDYLLSVMSDKEKEKFFRILDNLGERKDPALYLAIYEYILEKEGKVVSREYLKFLRAKGLGRYAIRQKKKLLRKVVNEDPVIHYIYNEYVGDKEEARKVYELLKKHGIIYGRVETRKEILTKYLYNEKLKKGLLEKEKIEEMKNTLLLLSIRDLENTFRLI